MPAGKTLEIDGSPHEMAIGEDQPLSFQGHAVHSGGSCQISLTSDISDDYQPRRDSRFFVIHSIEGGCPARNTSGNLDGPNVDQYTFQIPTGIDPGKYVLSWTWLPKGGSPEFYMNCSPITVVAAKTKAVKRIGPAKRREVALSKREDFPSMYMANLGSLTNGCTTNEAQKEGMAIAYPNPGGSVERANGDEKLFTQTCDGNPQTTGVSGQPSATTAEAKPSSASAVPYSPALSMSQTESTKEPSSSVAETPSSTTQAGTTDLSLSTMTTVITSTSSPPTPYSTVFSTTTLSPSSPKSSVAPSASATKSTESLVVIPVTTGRNATSAAATATSTAGSSASPTSGSGGASTSSDPTKCQEGYLLCVNGNMYSTCTGGRWTGPQPLASGTKCTMGAGVGLNITNPESCASAQSTA